MSYISLLQMVVQQTWQVALLAGMVWSITQTVGLERPHLSHMLWALVLVKCITPPIWSSPVGLFSQMSNHIGIAGNREPNALSDGHDSIHCKCSGLVSPVGLACLATSHDRIRAML